MSDNRSIIPRHEYIGGSSAATILGKNEYETRLELWQKKVERIDFDLSDNRHVMRGNLLEPIVEEWVREHIDPTLNSEANWKKHDFGLAQRRYEAREVNAQIMLMDKQLSPVHGKPFIGGHPDGVGDEILWEFKVPTSYRFERIVKDGMPDSWYYQIQHYLMISGLPQGCLAMWSFDRWEPYLVWVDPDPFMHDVMREEYARFWRAVELAEPPAEHAETTMEREHTEIVDDPKIEAALEAYQDAYERHYSAKDEMARARLQLLTLARDRKTLITPNFTAKITETTNYGKAYTRLTVRRRDDAEE